MYIFAVFSEKRGDSYKVEIPCFEESFECATDSEVDMVEQTAFFLKCMVMKCLLLHEEVPQDKCPGRKNNKQCRHTLAVKVDLPADGLFSVDETKRILCVSQPRVSNLIHNKRLIALKKGHYRLITRESLEAYLQTSRKAGRPTKANISQFDYEAVSQIEM